jgi:hypothetical protein
MPFTLVWAASRVVDLIPNMPAYNSTNLRLVYGKPFSQRSMSNPASSIESSDFIHLCPSELCGRPALAVNNNLAVLIDHITHVIGACSDPQMGIVAAGPTITMVKNKKSLRNWSVLQQPRSNVCGYKPGLSAPALDLAIPSSGDVPSPQPARPKFGAVLWNWSVFVYTLPKSISERIREALRERGILSKVARHIDSLFVNVLARVRQQPARAPSILPCHHNSATTYNLEFSKLTNLIYG